MVSRETYGESLRLLYYKIIKLKGQQGKTDIKAHEKIISFFRGNYATCYVSSSTEI